MKSITNKLMQVQSELKAPKNQFNAFAKYKYRSCEDIIEAVKPLLKNYGLVLTISDQVQIFGENRFYIQSTAVLICTETGETITTQAVAREPDEKKGTDASQLTGATSSYCRKYLLNGLFLIDDQKDADSQDNRDSAPVVKALDINKVLSALTDAKDSNELERLYKAAKSRATPEQLEVIDFTYNSIKGATA